ncbi:MAG: sigma-70 family RNA polymerase sigma factor [Ruminococcus sp.]|nr:sigma-70 family RNA polymerase sigma factor [Ruminococcus sp.]HRR77443.1 sigma-70 family RNA polymerase sigma factor [Ruminococcus sp.]
MDRKDSLKLQRLYELYEQPMYRIAFAVLRSSGLAEDAVSDAFVRIIKKLDRIGEADSPKTKSYIIKVIKSTSISIYRKHKQFYIHELPINEETMQLPDPAENVEEKVLTEDTDEMLSGVSDTDRKIIMLRCSSGLSWKEVAGKMSLTESGVRKRFERARKKIIETKGEKRYGNQ